MTGVAEPLTNLILAWLKARKGRLFLAKSIRAGLSTSGKKHNTGRRLTTHDVYSTIGGLCRDGRVSKVIDKKEGTKYMVLTQEEHELKTKILDYVTVAPKRRYTAYEIKKEVPGAPDTVLVTGALEELVQVGKLIKRRDNRNKRSEYWLATKAPRIRTQWVCDFLMEDHQLPESKAAAWTVKQMVQTFAGVRIRGRLLLYAALQRACFRLFKFGKLHRYSKPEADSWAYAYYVPKAKVPELSAELHPASVMVVDSGAFTKLQEAMGNFTNAMSAAPPPRPTWDPSALPDLSKLEPIKVGSVDGVILPKAQLAEIQALFLRLTKQG